MKLFIQSDINVSVEPQIINKCPHELSLKVLISPFCDNGAIMELDLHVFNHTCHVPKSSMN